MVDFIVEPCLLQRPPNMALIQAILNRDKKLNPKWWIEYLSPMFTKELRQGLRAKHFVWPFIVVQLGALAALVIEYFGKDSSNQPTEHAFVYFLITAFCIVLPLTNFCSLHSELASGRNIELLLMSGLTRWQIVLGKWMVANSLSALLLISLLPYWITRYSTGNTTDLSSEIITLINIVSLNWMFNAIVIGQSSFISHLAKIAMIVYASICGFTCFGINCLYLMELIRIPPSWISWFSHSLAILLAPIVPLAVATINLQFGRVKLRLYEISTEPSSATGLAVLMFISPIIVGTCIGPIGGTILISIALKFTHGVKHGE